MYPYFGTIIKEKSYYLGHSYLTYYAKSLKGAVSRDFKTYLKVYKIYLKVYDVKWVPTVPIFYEPLMVKQNFIAWLPVFFLFEN